MKKLLLVLVIMVSVHCMQAQRSVFAEMPQRLFIQGKEMYVDKNYAGCVHALENFKNYSKDARMIQEADFMIISSLFYQGDMNAGNLMKSYLEKYPETYHSNQLTFLIGSMHFMEKDWAKTIYWFSKCDIDYLSMPEQEDFGYRKAYASLQNGNKSDATNLFLLLTQKSARYGDTASYYLAYIHFQDGEYSKAIPVFRLLKSKPQFRENATFFLIQSTFLQGNLSETINESSDFLRTYPDSDNLPEVYRMLGASYYKQGDLNNAVKYYETYVSKSPDPMRQDLYQLGDCYYQLGRYSGVVTTMELVASTTDKVGQAGCMLLGQAYLKQNDASNALLAFDAAARSKYDPSISEAALFNYVMLTNRESYSLFGQSVTAFQRFLTEYPTSKYADQINSALANTLLSTKNYNVALDVINKISNPGKQVMDAKQVILLQRGIQAYIDGIYADASSDFTNTINMGTYNPSARNEAYFWRAETSYRNSNYNSAAKDYESYINGANPSQKNYAQAIYNLGYTDFQVKSYNRALVNFKKYVAIEKDRQSPGYADALNRIGDCYLYNRSFGEAERYYAQAYSANPSNADYSEFQKAFVMGLQHNYSGKVSALNSMIAKYPNSQYADDAMFEKARALVMLSREGDAISTLESLMKQFPSTNLTQKAGVLLGQLYFNANDTQRSIATYKKTIEYNPRSEEARAAIQSMEGVYKDVNDISGYANYVNSLGVGNVLSVNRQDSLTYLAAENVYMKGQKRESQLAMQRYLQIYPKGVYISDAHYYLGSMSYDAKDFDAALPHFKNVIVSNNPKYRDDALIMAAGILFDNKDYTSSFNYYSQLQNVAGNEENRNVGQLGMLRCAYLMKKDDDVISSAKLLLDNSNVSPDIALEARYYRGKSLRNKGRSADAISDFQLAAKDTRTVYGAESNYLLSQMYLDGKAYDKSEKQVLAFMKAGTSHEYWMARAVIVLSDTYAAKGDKFGARQYLENLKANYKGGEPDIASLIQQRLGALK